MTRCAIYARYSSDRQNERSIEDQIGRCRTFADLQGWTIVQVYEDAAISGFTMANRPGFLAAIAAAETREYDVLLSEHIDRFARNAEHVLNIYNRFKDKGASLWTVTTGEVNGLHATFLGYMAEEYANNLGDKTKRGMESNARQGKATGSKTFGYKGAEGGQITIVPEEAAVVRRIFGDCVAGDTARQIAAALNAEGVPGPRGKLWNQSTINGSPQRGNGILNCELYVGVKVWNRVQMRKDRSTGKRVSTARPREEWKRTPVPELRIIDEGTWGVVRARKDRETAEPRTVQRRPGIFSGLLKCGVCGGSYTIYTSGKLICATHREKGTCSNTRTPNRAKVEKRVLDSLRERLLSPEAIEHYVRAYQSAERERLTALTSKRIPLEKRLGEVKRSIERVIDAIVDGTANDAMKARMKTLDDERLTIEATLRELDEDHPVVTLHPSAAKTYAAMIERLQETLTEIATANPTRAQRDLIDAVRGLVEKIEIMPISMERSGPIDLILHGTLARFLHGAEQPTHGGLGALVAGGGLEPPTCGL